MNILFRVDAGGKTGLGHYYRSINLAKQLSIRGHKVFFVHKASDFWKNTNLQFTHWIVENEKEQLQYIKQNNINLFYVDSILEFSKEFINSIKESNCKIMFYQNISKTKHLCDYFILPSLHQKISFFKDFSKKTKIYQGLEYFTFNEKIIDIQKKNKTAKKIKKIGVISGGSDPKNILLKINKLLVKLNVKDVECNYFYGNNYMHKNNLPLQNSQHNFLPFQLEQVINSDLVISAFGVSTYECMALQLPVVGVGHQESNTNACNYLANKGFLISLGNIDFLTEELFNEKIMEVITDSKIRNKMVLTSSKNIDLLGVNRIINIIENE